MAARSPTMTMLAASGIDVAGGERAQIVGGGPLERGDETERLVERQAVKTDVAEAGGDAAGGGQPLGDAHQQGGARLGVLVDGDRALVQAGAARPASRGPRARSIRRTRRRARRSCPAAAGRRSWTRRRR